MGNQIAYEKMKRFISRNILYIIIAILSITYITTGFVAIQETGKSIMQIVGESILVFLFSYFIIQAFSLHGIMQGEASTQVESAREKHKQARSNIQKDIKYLYDWVTQKNIETEHRLKTEALCDYGLLYDEVLRGQFDKSRFTKKQLQKINRVKNKKITKLVASEIVNEHSNKNDPLFLGKSKKSFIAQRNLSSIMMKLIITIMFGYFTTVFIGFNWAEFIWKIVQVVMFLICGIMEYYRSYMYMTVEYTDILLKKADILNEFSFYLKEIKSGESY